MRAEKKNTNQRHNKIMLGFFTGIKLYTNFTPNPILDNMKHQITRIMAVCFLGIRAILLRVVFPLENR